MRYTSTRDGTVNLSAPEVIVRGLADDGGLYLPAALPKLPRAFWRDMAKQSYAQRAAAVMSPFLEEYADGLLALCQKAYAGFASPATAPVTAVGNCYFLELWHGPTCAFKDMALQALPYLLTASLDKLDEKRTACILVATSGDTGKAALEGFKDVPGTKIIVFYPRDGVSDMQKRQMTTQEGGNVGVCAVEGNFDDAQNGVKAIFSDDALRREMNGKGLFFSSANSINWGRVLPQIAYYCSAYADMVAQGQVDDGAPINICVPTGNFGNILSARYAGEMGLPVGKLICASNQNDVLTQFLRTGLYDRKRRFYNTLSPSMDILISSNLERALFSLSGQDDERVRRWMTQLRQTGSYQVEQEIQAALDTLFYAGTCNEAQTRQTIADTWQTHRYLLDPHTAVGLEVYNQYRRETGDTTPTLVVSTASPFKFATAVLSALGKPVSESGNEARLSALTGQDIPAPLNGLFEKPVRFGGTVGRDRMAEAVRELL